MDVQKYRLNLSFVNLYREIELSSDAEQSVVIGTTRRCNVRLARDSFFRDFEITLVPGQDGQWDILCSDSCYISQDHVLKLHRLTVQHGDSFVFYYQAGDAELCRGEFLRDFDILGTAYSRYISLSDLNRFSIGGSAACQLQLHDPAVGSGFAELTRTGSGWTVTDRGTRYGININGSRVTKPTAIYEFDFFSLSGHSFYLRRDRLYFCADPTMEARGLSVYEHRDSATQMVYPHLNRSTRIYYKLPDEHLQIQSPPTKREPPKQNIMMSLLPMLAMLVLTVLLRGVMGGGGTFVIFSACSMGIGMVTSILNYRREKKESTQGEKKRVEGYTAYMQEKETFLAQERTNELALLEENTPAIDRTMQTVWQFDRRLYERTPADADFLAVRLGSGPRDALCPIDIKQEEYKIVDDPLADWPEQIEKRYHTLEQAPVLLPLREYSSVGLLGSAQDVYEMVKLMVLDLCVRHSYLDLRLCCFLPEQDSEKWAWIRWLRHIRDSRTGMRSIAYNADSCKYLTETLYKELSERETQSQAAGADKDKKPLPHYVVFIQDPYDIMAHPLSRFFDSGSRCGVTFVFCSNSAELLPKCARIVELNGNASRILNAEDGSHPTAFHPALLPDEQAARAAVKLASITVDEVSLSGQLTRNITLYKLLHIFTADDLELGSRWSSSQVYKSMAAPLGVDAKGGIVCLDLHEKADGPHGLVAGTTGSGKSEILQSYILSMAALFHPYDVGFVIIDFKGGGMVNQFRGLPHLIGSITDIDGREINRSLLSIRAELNKRKELFAAAGVNHIDQYIRKFKDGELSVPLPHLILIVDEFAELKAEQPDFMKELISTARVGRSLGVHLILATQKPSGVVDAQIWSNSRFRLCLKVATPEDSKEMLKTPLAAEIREPGRAYLQVGNNEVFELFQSAYSGAPADSEIATGQRSYHIDELDLSGARSCLYKSTPKTVSRNKQTQLQEMVEMFRTYCEAHHIERLPGICLPPLPAVLPCPALPAAKANGSITALLGLYDDPEHQAQRPYSVSLSAGHIMVVGASLSGKTCLLQQILFSLASQYTPDEVNLYIVDFASRALGIFAEENHVSGCVFNDQEDRVRTLMRLLLHEVRARKEAFARVGITSFNGYREAGLAADTPQIVVLMDNFLAFRELYPQYDDDLLYLLREGISVGVCIVATVQQSTGMGFRYMNSFGTRILMHCNDAGEYATVLDRCRIQPKNTAGRAVVCPDKVCYEMQTYLAFSGEQEMERVESIRAFLAQVKTRFGAQRARRLPEVPETMLLSWLLANDRKAEHGPYTLPIGMSYEQVETVYLALADTPLFTLCGNSDDQVNLLQIVLAQLQKQVLTARSKVYLLDHYDRRLESCRCFGVVERYTSDSSEAEFLLEELQNAVEERRQWLRSGNTESLRSAPLLVFLVRSPDFYTAGKPVDELFKTIHKAARGLKIALLLAEVENTAISFSANGIMKTIRENRSMLYFGRLDALRVYDLSPTVLRANKNVLHSGDGYLLTSDSIDRIKTAKADD